MALCFLKSLHNNNVSIPRDRIKNFLFLYFKLFFIGFFLFYHSLCRVICPHFFVWCNGNSGEYFEIGNMLSVGRAIFCKCNSLELVVMKKIQAYKHVSHKTDSNKAYFILQFLQIFAIFCNFYNFCNF